MKEVGPEEQLGYVARKEPLVQEMWARRENGAQRELVVKRVASTSPHLILIAGQQPLKLSRSPGSYPLPLLPLSPAPPGGATARVGGRRGRGSRLRRSPSWAAIAVPEAGA